MPAPVFSVGVDVGGTWIRLEALDANGRRVKSFKSPSPTLPQLPSFLKKRLRSWKVHPAHLNVGSRGIWAPAKRAQLKRALRGLAKSINVMSDVEAAWHGAFGNRGTGILVISGTGSIAYGRDADGCSERTGGFGPLRGDEGSGFWIGKTWLKRFSGQDVEKKLVDHPQTLHRTVRQVAGLIPKIFRKAQKGDTLAQVIINQACAHLAAHVWAMVPKLHFSGPIPVSWGGGVLDNSWFRKRFIQTLCWQKEPRFMMCSPKLTAAEAIARLPLDD